MTWYGEPVPELFGQMVCVYQRGGFAVLKRPRKNFASVAWYITRAKSPEPRLREHQLWTPDHTSPKRGVHFVKEKRG